MSFNLFFHSILIKLCYLTYFPNDNEQSPACVTFLLSKLLNLGMHMTQATTPGSVTAINSSK